MVLGGFHIQKRAIRVARHNQLDPQTQTMTSSVQYQAARGVFVISADYPRITSGDATNVPPLKLINSQVNF
jgi:hypothetical protein